MSECIPPVLQPRKPTKIEDLLEECAMAALTHDHPRKFVAARFAENEKAIELQRKGKS